MIHDGIKLKKYLESKGMVKAHFADKLGLKKPYLNYLFGRKFIGEKMKNRLNLLMQVDDSFWYKDSIEDARLPNEKESDDDFKKVCWELKEEMFLMRKELLLLQEKVFNIEKKL